MAATEPRRSMVRKQYYLSVENIHRLEQLQAESGDSEAALVRRAIDAFDPALPGMEQQELIEKTALGLLEQLHTLDRNMAATLRRTRAIHNRISDPDWIAGVREQTRHEAAADPALVEGLAALLQGSGT